MNFISTRGQSPAASFRQMLLGGLAPDGGLYLPQEWPRINMRQSQMTGASYPQVAAKVLAPFLQNNTKLDSVWSQFSHSAVAPLVQISPHEWILELFHGPTLAFKDLAMALLAELMEKALGNRHAVIIGATSGDTGAAALSAFRKTKHADIFILYPHNRISTLQRRQMTCSTSRNAHPIAIQGSFDDCQNIVKNLFADPPVPQLLGVNSINFARVMAQIVYYFAAAAQLREPVSFAVPTGNAGNVFAGFAAQTMGAPIHQLFIAANANDVVARALASGRFQPRKPVHTISPSMDIQIPSNFERLIFEALSRRPNVLKKLLASLEQKKFYDIPPQARRFLSRRIRAASVSETQTRAAIRNLYRETGRLIDPHSAVGLAAARQLRKPDDPPVIILSTAHPAKFPDAVKRAAGIRPPIPPSLAALLRKKEKRILLPPSADAVRRYILQHARAA